MMLEPIVVLAQIGKLQCDKAGRVFRGIEGMRGLMVLRRSRGSIFPAQLLQSNECQSMLLKPPRYALPTVCSQPAAPSRDFALARGAGPATRSQILLRSGKQPFWRTMARIYTKRIVLGVYVLSTALLRVWRSAYPWWVQL